MIVNGLASQWPSFLTLTHFILLFKPFSDSKATPVPSHSTKDDREPRTCGVHAHCMIHITGIVPT